MATSLDHHLARRHGTQMGRRLWRCTYCDKTMAGLETREHRCGGPRHVKPAGGPKRSRAGPPVPAPVQPKRSCLSNSERQDGPRRRIHDGDERSPAADPRRMPTRPEMPRPTIAARNDLPGGDGDQSTDEGEDHDEDSLPQPDWTPPRDEMESAGEREDDVHAPSLPTTSRPEPRDHYHSAGRGEDHDSLPPEEEEVCATPRPGTSTRTGPASPPATSDNNGITEELSPTLVTAIARIDTSGGSTGGGGVGGGST